MKQKLSVLLACCMLLAVSGCSSGTNSNPDTGNSVPTPSTVAEGTPSDKNGYTPEDEKLHITVESVDVTVDELKANDYQVLLTVDLDKNPGFTSAQWGLQFEKNCTSIKGSNTGMIVGTVHAVNDDTHFLWTAWAGTESTDTGGLLKVGVTLPRDAKPGNTYTVTYADTSATGAAHQWKSTNANWVEEDAVGWTDGVITVVE